MLSEKIKNIISSVFAVVVMILAIPAMFIGATFVGMFVIWLFLAPIHCATLHGAGITDIASCMWRGVDE